MWVEEHTFSVDGCQVSVLEERDKISLSSLLESHHSRRLEAQVSLWHTDTKEKVSQITLHGSETTL